MRTPQELNYIRETRNLVKLFQGQNSPLTAYIRTCNDYIRELRSKDTLQEYFKAEQEKLFVMLLSLVEEDFRPDHFISMASFDFIDIFEPEFMIYMLRCQNQLKKPLKWKAMCELEFKFSILKLRYEVETRFESDFLDYAIHHLTLKDLWMRSTN